MDRIFAPPEGRIFSCFPGAEERPGQRRMAELVFDAVKAGETRFGAWRQSGGEADSRPDGLLQAIEFRHRVSRSQPIQ